MRITTLINLTPHDVSIILASGERLTVEAQPVPARVEQSHTVIAVSDDDTQSGRTVEIAAPVYGEIVGLPAPIPTVAYICSVFVAAAAAAKGRTDVLYPDSGPDAWVAAGLTGSSTGIMVTSLGSATRCRRPTWRWLASTGIAKLEADVEAMLDDYRRIVRRRS